MHAALVELVEDDRSEIREQRILLQARRQHALGRDEQTRRGAEPALEADLPADLAADRPAALVGDARGDRARGDAPRLQQNERSRRRASAGGTRVVLPAPGAAVTTTARERRTAVAMSSRYGSMGSGRMRLAPGLRASVVPILVVASPPRHRVTARTHHRGTESQR